jgi:hypothetical protein
MTGCEWGRWRRRAAAKDIHRIPSRFSDARRLHARTIVYWITQLALPLRHSDRILTDLHYPCGDMGTREIYSF